MDKIPLRQGAEVTAEGVRFAIWAPQRKALEAHVYSLKGEVLRRVPLRRDADGFFRATDARGKAGDLYKYAIEGVGEFPDPASRYQPMGVHGPSCVVDPRSYAWQDQAWQRPPFRDLAIYELHVGTFTPEGTFRAAIGKLPYLAELGVSALELMPLADFPGERNWGYDGVQLFAPAHSYGTPDDLRALVDAAHAHGLAVILDVVYNHFGPDGNYVTQFSPLYFSPKDRTPWGSAVNFGHEGSAAVRDFYKSNVLYWMDDFHLDGFRLDATHAIIDQSEPHIMVELARLVHERGGYIIAEDERNEARLIREVAGGGFGFDGVWADDFHHIVEVGLIEASVYARNFGGELAELVSALEQGWHYCGQPARKSNLPRGTRTDGLAPERFVFCISNHDQVGNRAFGERLSHLVEPAEYRAASALLLLAPATPLLFMGQEFASSSPFQYFTDHGEELGRAVEKGRREEFADAFEKAGEVPSPQAVETFLRSKLQWEETGQAAHAQTLALYRELLQLRKHAAFRPPCRGSSRFAALGELLGMRLTAAGEDFLILCDLAGGHGASLHETFCGLAHGKWKRVLSTNEPRFGGSGAAKVSAAGEVHFPEPELLVLAQAAP